MYMHYKISTVILSLPFSFPFRFVHVTFYLVLDHSVPFSFPVHFRSVPVPFPFHFRTISVPFPFISLFFRTRSFYFVLLLIPYAPCYYCLFHVSNFFPCLFFCNYILKKLQINQWPVEVPQCALWRNYEMEMKRKWNGNGNGTERSRTERDPNGS